MVPKIFIKLSLSNTHLKHYTENVFHEKLIWGKKEI